MKYITLICDQDFEDDDIFEALEAASEMLHLHGLKKPGVDPKGGSNGWCGDKFCTTRDHKNMVFQGHILEDMLDNQRELDEMEDAPL